MEKQIEQYFSGELTEAEKRQFEAALKNDSGIADDTAFYLQTKLAAELAANEHLKVKHEYWTALPSEINSRFKRNTWIKFAAAVLLVTFIVFYFKSPFQSELSSRATDYITNNLKKLPLHLGEEEYSLQNAIEAYNQQDYNKAITLTHTFLNQSPHDAEALKVLGLAHLQLQQYKDALRYFQQLGEQQHLYSNPGKYYEALTYLSRNRDDDTALGKKLLNEVITNDLEGKQDARKLLE